MLTQIAYEAGPRLATQENVDLTAGIGRVLYSGLAGFVIGNARKSYKNVCSVADELGLRGDRKASVPFEHNSRVEEAIGLLRNGSELQGTWRDYGVTQLHADGDEGDQMLSIIRVKKGSFEIRAFERGPGVKGIPAVDLFDVLEGQTGLVLTEDRVDTDMVAARATVLRASKDDIVVFNPSQLHMAITLEGPRLSESTFFQKLS